MGDVYDRAFEFCQRWEGGLCNDKADPGGMTNRGVSLRFLRSEGIDIDGDGDIDEDDIRAVTKEDARRIFKKYFWPRVFDEVAVIAPRVSICLFDAAMNMGLKTSIKLLQKGLGVSQDGIIGPKTLSALKDSGDFMTAAAMLEMRKYRYHEICMNRPASRVFLKGWLNRVSALCVEISK